MLVIVSLHAFNLERSKFALASPSFAVNRDLCRVTSYEEECKSYWCVVASCLLVLRIMKRFTDGMPFSV